MELEEGTAESGDGLGTEKPDCGFGDASAAKNDCETSESRREARFWDFVNLRRGNRKLNRMQHTARHDARISALELFPLLSNTGAYAAHPSS